MRLCKVDNKTGYFHTWEHYSKPIPASPYIGGSPEGVFSRLYGLNTARDRFLETNDKKYWWQMVQLLPSSYNQRRMVMINYQTLRNIYKQRKNHKLDEWQDFCKFLEYNLPYSELVTMED